MAACIPSLSGCWPGRLPAVRNVAALSVQPLSRAELVEQADGDAQR
jgi:hypothetical protein